MINKRTKNLIILSSVLFALLLLYSVGISISRIGKTRVDITVIPQDAAVMINGSKSSSGSKYLKPGSYTFSASKEGFSDYAQEVTIGKEKVQIGLVPEPTSDEAFEWIANNPDIQTEREALGGIAAAQKGAAIIEKDPIIASLPYTSVVGPFTIDYGYSEQRENKIFITIRNSSPDGRANALQWIRERGIDPTDLEIRYADFTNPLVLGGSL